MAITISRPQDGLAPLLGAVTQAAVTELAPAGMPTVGLEWPLLAAAARVVTGTVTLGQGGGASYLFSTALTVPAGRRWVLLGGNFQVVSQAAAFGQVCFAVADIASPSTSIIHRQDFTNEAITWSLGALVPGIDFGQAIRAMPGLQIRPGERLGALTGYVGGWGATTAATVTALIADLPGA